MCPTPTFHSEEPVVPASSTPLNQIASRLLTHAGLPLDAPILDLGSSSASFLDDLLAQGYTNLIAANLSPGALEVHQQQLEPVQAERVLWLVDDVTQARHLPQLGPVLLWHDRAMLRVLTLPVHLTAYRQLLDHMVEPGQGWVMLSVALPGGPLREGDFLAHPYELSQLAAFLGGGYALIDHHPYVHTLPSGELQPNVYALFQRRALSLVA
ncbi:hypothetical protein [Hymenobacter mucosus]|uniref:Methyltransferase domain-containing protein n=1 Tax=Hymenobacter mucosus TaxID=1411120 RepID=A0A238Z9Z1_9BACT|nr:hypothetical protein [Hymenobacter mucosus]SNR80355.1 hypothetical protein SAMN06269173_10766 [Hymenobacter mucosus]